AQLSRKEIKVGDSATITISVAGKGNIHDIPEPVIPDIPDFKFYEDKPSLDVDTTLDGISGTKTFKKALVPTKPGEYRIPPIKVPFLDPDSGTYRIASTQPISITVLSGTEEEKLNLVEGEERIVKKEEIKLLGKDILPPMTSIAALRDQSVRWLNPLLLLMIFLPPFTFFSFFVSEKKKRHMAADQAFYCRKKAFAGWKERRKTILSLIEKKPDKFYSQTSRSLRQFLGDRLTVTGQALTAQEMDKKLEDRHVPPDLRTLLKGHLQVLEKGAFGVLNQDTEERKALFKDLEKAINRLLRYI
ncbi:MAG: BatD family protein, partial [bacterium]